MNNDNPYIVSQFRTLKYRPEFPDRFDCVEDAQTHCRRFFGWYNDEHRHSGIGFHTPPMFTTGEPKPSATSAGVLDAAYAAHPERFVSNPPRPPALPTTARINKPPEDAATTQ